MAGALPELEVKSAAIKVPERRADVAFTTLRQIEERVLWLATRMIDAANHERHPSDGVKIGGHQASSASMVSIMSALWFSELRADDYVSVKPHASPVFHAIQYLLGNLDRDYLTRLRAFGGLQSYPSRTKDPDRVDFSTGSVGLGAAAPLFASVVRRYIDSHFGARRASRFIALIGDAELDEGNVWEAVADPVTQGLENVLWIVDFNRQSLDRVVPGIRISQWRSQFEAAGWHAFELKYGRSLEEMFRRPNGTHLREWIDSMSNEQYQSLFGLMPSELRERFLEGAPPIVRAIIEDVENRSLKSLVADLGGHDLQLIIDSIKAAESVRDRPSVIFAYTVKGWGLPIAGNPGNHSALLTEPQIAELRARSGLTVETEWDRFDDSSPAGVLCRERGSELTRRPHSSHSSHSSRVPLDVPRQVNIRAARRGYSTQEAFGRILVELSRDETTAPYLVTTAPDVATSTNLAGFINRMGIFAPGERPTWNEESLVRWIEGPSGHHIELGISEMNLFMLLCQLGQSWDLSDQPLIPIGTVYDPFVCRGLDALIYGAYSGASFIVAGTPSGVTLAPEGGAHQSIITSSIGIELPNATLMEPAYVGALDWMLCDAVRSVWQSAMGDEPPRIHYFRLTTRPIDQTPFEEARGRLGDELLRRQVLTGGYLLRDPEARTGESNGEKPSVYLAASGPVMPEVLEAADELAEEGVAAYVVDITSADRLYATWRSELMDSIRRAVVPGIPEPLRWCFPHSAPIVTVQDAASHAMGWLGSVLGSRCLPLGVDSFGQSGSVQDLYAAHDLAPGSIVNAALAVLTRDDLSRLRSRNED